MELRHCVIPAAGLGTRFLPATKALPKELLPVLDRPVIQWGVEEAVAAGSTTMVMVISRGKELIRDHFAQAPVLEKFLEQRGKQTELEAVRYAENLATFEYVYQDEPHGLGHAVLCAESVVGHNAFTCLLPDDLSMATRPILAQLADVHRETGTSVLALMRVPRDRISRYGCVAVAESRGRIHRLSAVVEKPPADLAPSDLAIMGRYVLTPNLWDALHATQPGAGGEIQLTDGIAKLIEHDAVWGVEFDGELLDVGTPSGWLATNVRLGGHHPALGNALREAIAEGGW